MMRHGLNSYARVSSTLLLLHIVKQRSSESLCWTVDAEES